MKFVIESSTEKQREYIEQLLIDVGISTKRQRDVFLSDILNRPIKYLDELSKIDAMKIIDILKDRKNYIEEDQESGRL